MSYDKVLVDLDGEKYPYSESIVNGKYYYQISIVWCDRDGELIVVPNGTHIEFDDDGSWLDFNFSPNTLFHDERKLTENKLIRLLNVLWEHRKDSTMIPKENIDKKYQEYLAYLKSKEL